MIRLTLVALTLFVISLMCTGISYAETWYTEDFNDFNDGDVAGQDGWEIAHGQASGVIQGNVASGNTGKSILMNEATFVVISFPDAHADIQHVSFHCRKDSETGWLLHYIGGGGIGWGAAAVFPFPPGTTLKAISVGDELEIAELTLGEWSYFHVVLDFTNQTYDFYVDGAQVADDFGFRGGDNPSLDWFAFGWNKAEEPLVAYIDNLSAGTGEGDPNPPTTAAVSSSDKLATTWAELKW